MSQILTVGQKVRTEATGLSCEVLKFLGGGGQGELHARGLCYRDISFGNAFFDPETGEVLICDNDNVTVDAQAKGGVYGTPRFMSPEIVRGETAPNSQTDLFSLSVLLFYMFMMHH